MSRAYDSTQTVNFQYVLTPANPIYDSLPALSYAAWIYLTFPSTNADQRPIMIKNVDSGLGPLFAVDLDGQLLSAVLLTSNFASVLSISNTPLVLNKWNHVAFTYDSAGDNVIHLYINGVEVPYQQQIAGDGTIQNDSGVGIYIGNDLAPNPWGGYIAECAVWNVALSAADVASIAASTTGYLGLTATAPIGYWHLCGTGSTEPDSSGNGNTATLSPNPPTRGPNSPGYTKCGPPPPPPPQPTANGGGPCGWSSASYYKKQFPENARTYSLPALPPKKIF